MNMNDAKEKTKKLIEEVLEIEVNTDDFFNEEVNNLNISSILYIKLLVKLETDFDVTFPEEIVLINKKVTINDMVEFIVNYK